MKFVIFTFIFIGMSNALFGTLKGMTGVISGLDSNAKGMNSIRDAVLSLDRMLTKSTNPSATLSSYTDGFMSAAYLVAMQRFANNSYDLAKTFDRITESSLFSLDVLALNSLVPYLNNEAEAKNALSSVVSNFKNGIGVSTTSSVDLSGAANALHNLAEVTQNLTAAVKKLKGVTGALVGMAATNLINLTAAIRGASVACVDFGETLQSNARYLAGVDFSGVIKGFKNLSDIQAGLVDVILSLTGLTSIVGGVLGGKL